MTAVSPAEFAVLADDLTAAAKLIARYEALYESGYTRRVGGQQGNGTETVHDVALMLQTTTTIRAKLDTASRQLAQAVAAVAGADKALAEVEGLIDLGADRTLDVTDRERRRPATQAEVLDAEAARKRRVDRGEGVPMVPAELRALEQRMDRLRKRHKAKHGDEPLRCPRCAYDMCGKPHGHDGEHRKVS